MYMLAQKKFIEDLSEILIQYYNDMSVTFLLGNCSDFYPEDIFKSDDLLILFLYNKQKFLNQFCKDYLPKTSFLEFIYESTDSLESSKNYNSGYVFANVTCKHNIEQQYQYLQLLKFMTVLIITDSYFTPSAKKIVDLNKTYSKFIEDCKSEKFKYSSYL